MPPYAPQPIVPGALLGRHGVRTAGADARIRHSRKSIREQNSITGLPTVLARISDACARRATAALVRSDRSLRGRGKLIQWRQGFGREGGDDRPMRRICNLVVLAIFATICGT